MSDLKTAISLLVAGLLFVLGGCRVNQTKSDSTQVAPPDDRAETLLWHLSQRADDADKEINRLQNEVLKHDKKCLEEQIATLEGKAHSTYPKTDPDAAGAALVSNLSRMVQGVLDAEDIIEYHNRKHPESPQADMKDMLRDMCGDCTRERAIRDAQLKEVAEKYEHNSKR